MECSDVVGATGGTVGVASSMGIGDAEVGDAGAGGIVSVGSSLCSSFEGTGGATMGGAPGGA